jgi:hypothetical protein
VINARMYGLDRFDRYMKDVAKQMPIAAAQGINRAAEQTRTLASKAIREQVALKKKYVDERLTIKKAYSDSLWASISTPVRGMLLSRFPTRPALSAAAERLPRGKRGISVRVKPQGSYKLIAGAFFMRLRYGKTLGDNLGIAVRPKAGGKPVVRHGPSVSQVFNGVREDIAPEVRGLAQKNVERSLDRALEAIR